jgi:hypothetical protein
MNASRNARHSLRSRLRAALSEIERGAAARQRVLATQFYASAEPGPGRVIPLPKSFVRP